MGSDEEIQRFQDLFDEFDKDHSGEIDTVELMGILESFGWQPKSKEAQAQLMHELDVARALASEAGIKEVGADGSPNIRFWSFVQLARMLKRESEHAEELQMHALMKELGFSEQEVEQFRVIFRSWIKAEVEKAAEVDETITSDGLLLPGIRRMVRFLGCQLTAELADKLSHKAESLFEDGVLKFF